MARTKVYGPVDSKIRFPKLTKTTAKILKKKGSIFNWIAPSYPEDIAFYNKKYKPIFDSVAHENIAFIVGKKKIVKKAKKTISNLDLRVVE